MLISSFSIRRPVFTLVTMFIILILGGVSLLRIPLKLIPDISPPVGVVVATYPGASPVEVVEKLTKPLEANLATLPGIKNVTSTSQEGTNLILMEFSWDTSIDDIQNEVLQRIDQTPLPEDANKPRFLKFDPSQFPIIQVSLQGLESEVELKELAEALEQELTRVKGVASVNMSGTLVEEIRIELNQDELKKYSLSQSDVVNLIAANNISMPGNTIEAEGKSLTTRVLSTLTSLEEIKQLTIVQNPVTNEKISLSDIANVQQQQQEVNSITRANGEPSVLLSVLQESDANTASVSTAFQAELAKLLEKEKYEGIQSDVLFDQGKYIQDAMGNISNALILGGAFAMLVLFFFLRNVKSPLIIGIAIPYSVIVTFVLMYFAKFSLNIMTLGALALGIGMLVDNAIVVIENIYRHLSLGKGPKQAALDGAKEVGSAITASTLTTVAVFVPVVFITGLIGELFTEFALTISFSLIASLVVALTVIPMLASRWLKPVNRQEEAKVRRRKKSKWFEKSIHWTLRHRLVVIVSTLLLLGIGAYGLTTVGTQFLPATDEGYFTMQVELENGSTFTETEKVVQNLENQLAEEDLVELYVSLIGTTQEASFRGSSQQNVAEIYVKLISLDERNQSIFSFVDEVKPKLEQVADGAQLSFNLQSTSGSAPQTLTFTVQDTSKERLDKAVNSLQAGMEEIQDVTDVSIDVMETVKEVQMVVDREKALQFGMFPATVASEVNNITRGVQVTQIISNTSDVYPVFIQYDKDITSSIDSLKNLSLKTPQGTYVKLDDIVEIKEATGPVRVQRINQQNAVQFTVNYLSDTNLGEISKLVDEKIKELNLSNETEINFSGDRELFEDSIDDMIMAIVLAILLIYLVMAAQFESLKYPLVIMITVPLMVIGVAIALTITKTPISISAVIGLLVLAGIVVNNAIVLVDYINQQKEKGLSSYDAIVISVKNRVRPILMTALTTILGLLPLALGLGEGTEINQPMGISVIGGLISSTFLTLFLIPIVYSLFDKETRRKKKEI
ncbi:efflux RND transporter permease subunit [Bacillus spongiae]|uniref:Efflux RND transporter permease subunit n=1 Tax=Bacillus spongiae TaxID=2683610 RepID=A0ABU8H9L3_9BACI